MHGEMNRQSLGATSVTSNVSIHILSGLDGQPQRCTDGKQAQRGDGIGPGYWHTVSVWEKHSQEIGRLTCDYPYQHTSLSPLVCAHENDHSPGKQETSLGLPACARVAFCTKAFCTSWEVRLTPAKGAPEPCFLTSGTFLPGWGQPLS